MLSNLSGRLNPIKTSNQNFSFVLPSGGFTSNYNRSNEKIMFYEFDLEKTKSIEEYFLIILQY